ncbi:MAG: hypothetical protein AAGI23_03240 [Bacteroidota bacterium]
MRYFLLFFLPFIHIVSVQSQNLKTKPFLQYSDFGAKGDGKTDDLDAIIATHAFANEHQLPVKADEGYTYYIGGEDRTAIIQTNTDFGTAQFIIDDTQLENRQAPVFVVQSSLQSFPIEGLATLKRNQEKIDIALSQSCLITVTNSNVKHYIRFGLNQNNGSPQTDIFVVDQAGNVDMNAPIIWDFDTITSAKVLPIDSTTLTITGGRFTTIANQAESKYDYHHRNLTIQRSNVIVDGLEHRIIGEGNQGAPYSGFITIKDCAYVTVKNALLTGHKTYQTIGAAGKPVSMGSYDLSVGRSLNVSFINCRQTNNIHDLTYWGILGSNYCKNLLYDNCTLSRFDAHKGVANATIRNSTLGHMGINAIGSGTLTVENTTVRGRGFIKLRTDYGSTWQGEFIIRNCTFIPEGNLSFPALISGYYSGQHDFGYTCYMPERILLESVHIDDTRFSDNYQYPVVFSDFNSEMTDEMYEERFPYVRTQEVVLDEVTTDSGKAIRLSSNLVFFEGVEVRRK